MAKRSSLSRGKGKQIFRAGARKMHRKNFQFQFGSRGGRRI